MVFCLLHIGPGVNSTKKTHNYPPMEDPEQNNDVTCGMPVIDLVRGDGIQVPHMHLRGDVGRLLSPCSGNAGHCKETSQCWRNPGDREIESLLVESPIGIFSPEGLIFDRRLHHDRDIRFFLNFAKR